MRSQIEVVKASRVCSECALFVANDDVSGVTPERAFELGSAMAEFIKRLKWEHPNSEVLSWHVEPEEARACNLECEICRTDLWGVRYAFKIMGRSRRNPFDGTGYLTSTIVTDNWHDFGAIQQDGIVTLYVLTGSGRREMKLTPDQVKGLRGALGEALEIPEQPFIWNM